MKLRTMFLNRSLQDEENVTQLQFDPYLNRTVRSPLTNFQAFASFVKICTGLGLMVSAEAVGHGGYVMGFVFIPLIGLLLTFLLHMQFRSRYVLCKKLKLPFLTYSQGLKLCIEEGPRTLVAVKNLSSTVVDFISVINQFGSSSICLMYVASSVEESYAIPARKFILILMPFMMIFVFINDLKGLLPFNYLALLLQLGGLSIIFYYIFTDLPPLSSKVMVQRPPCWALFFARFLGATEAVAVVVNIEKDMGSPEAFLKPFGVLNLSMLTIVTAYYIFGTMGNIKYGLTCCLHYDHCLPLTSLIPVEETAANIGKIFYLIGVALTYGLCCFPAHTILWTKFFEKCFGNAKSLKYLFRAIIITGTCVLALIDPQASVPVSLIVNTLCLSFLAIIFPTVLHLCLLWPNNYGWLHIMYWWDLMLILVGIIFIFISLYQVLWVILQLSGGQSFIEPYITHH